MREIPLTQGKVAIVDDDVYVDVVSFGKWYARNGRKTYYAQRSIRGTNGKWIVILMHNVIWELLHGPIPDGFTVDHEDRDGLNNTRENLRLATRQNQNRNRGKFVCNSSGYTGVSWAKRQRKWRAQAGGNSNRIHLGYFDCPIVAAMARDRFVFEHYGEFAEFNFL
jgi:HNH endonuclease